MYESNIFRRVEDKHTDKKMMNKIFLWTSENLQFN